jgi:hypothetical protein
MRRIRLLLRQFQLQHQRPLQKRLRHPQSLRIHPRQQRISVTTAGATRDSSGGSSKALAAR